MSQSEDTATDGNRAERGSSETTNGGYPADGGVAEWFAASALRIGLAVIGFVLLLFALGQAVGLDLLGLVVDALNTEVGRWLAVAVFALVLIVVALRGFSTRAES